MQSENLNPDVQSSAEEIATEMLGVDTTRRPGSVPQSKAECHGSLLGLDINGSQYEFGVLSRVECAYRITASMLGIEDDDEEPLCCEDIIDAMGELANLIAGRLKGKLASRGGQVVLSTPQELAVHQIPNELFAFHTPQFEFSVFLNASTLEEITQS